jgi:hypothetical protein
MAPTWPFRSPRTCLGGNLLLGQQAPVLGLEQGLLLGLCQILMGGLRPRLKRSGHHQVGLGVLLAATSGIATSAVERSASKAVWTHKGWGRSGRLAVHHARTCSAECQDFYI